MKEDFSETNNSLCTVYITTSNRAEAERLASQLLEARLVACATILNQAHSVYRWQGQIHHDNEVVLLLKTRQAHCPEIEKLVKKEHSYECPCIVVWPIVAGFEPYLQWVRDETSK